MRTLMSYGVYVLLVALTLSGCVGVAGESYGELVDEAKLEILAESVLEGHGDVETCMFTVWYFTEPDAPEIEMVEDMCKVIVTSMDEYEFAKVMDEIKEELSRPKDEPVICVGNCT